MLGETPGSSGAPPGAQEKDFVKEWEDYSLSPIRRDWAIAVFVLSVLQFVVVWLVMEVKTV
jgi:hypothetical protein